MVLVLLLLLLLLPVGQRQPAGPGAVVARTTTDSEVVAAEDEG